MARRARGDEKTAPLAAPSHQDELESVLDDFDSIQGDLDSDRADSPGQFDTDLPPQYSQANQPPPSTSQTLLRVPTLLTMGVPAVNLAGYCIPNSSISKDMITINVADGTLSSSPQRLSAFLREQIPLPPKVEIRITGSHKDSIHPHQPTIDFDIRINAVNFFLPMDGRRGMSYVSGVNNGRGAAVDAGASGIDTWARAFCKDDSASKTLTIYRDFKNWNTEYIEGCVRNLGAQLKYAGELAITFPTYHSRVVVSNSSSIWSFGSAIKSMFSEPRKHEVHVAWPYATHPPGVSGERRCLVQNEETWWTEWRSVLRRAVLAQHVGWLGPEAWMELATSPQPKQKGTQPWGKDHH